MIELIRWIVPNGTFIPGNGYPKLQYRQVVKVWKSSYEGTDGKHYNGYETEELSEWVEVLTHTVA